MTRRLTTTLLCGLYLVLALWGGALAHHHHADAGAHSDQDCAVCVWQATHQTDIPAPVALVSSTPVATPVVAYLAQPHFTFFALSSASRAPPLS